MSKDEKKCEDCHGTAVLSVDRDQNDIFLCRTCAVKLINALGEAVRSYDVNVDTDQYQCQHLRTFWQRRGVRDKEICMECGHVVS